MLSNTTIAPISIRSTSVADAAWWIHPISTVSTFLVGLCGVVTEGTGHYGRDRRLTAVVVSIPWNIALTTFLTVRVHAGKCEFADFLPSALTSKWPEVCDDRERHGGTVWLVLGHAER